MTDTGDALAPGTRLDEFEIERVLGAGGFGVTYRARDSAARPVGGAQGIPATDVRDAAS